ncbi:hypothetical protein J21TS3_44360 [Paenibacillus cookii]|uniref:Uncharacterized protein n=1 Tax=Paenibacillus cookii TaxID=157839 RepID=A0ABQ4M247_9BACL|nr:hypothetical protein J21TS3_44360 [Paenibacillus cookii]
MESVALNDATTNNIVTNVLTVCKERTEKTVQTIPQISSHMLPYAASEASLLLKGVFLQ